MMNKKVGWTQTQNPTRPKRNRLIKTKMKGKIIIHFILLEY